MESTYFKEAIEPSAKRRPALVMIPGNPGLMDFYITYIELLQQEFPKFDILILGNLFEQKKNEERVLYGLEYQTNHKLESLRKYVHSQDKVVDFYFLTHSIGSYIGQILVKHLTERDDWEGQFSIKFVGLMFPTIRDIAKSKSGQVFLMLSRRLPLPTIASTSARILNTIIPEWVLDKIIRGFFIAKPRAVSAESMNNWNLSVEGAKKIIKSPAIVWQVVALAKEEMEVVKDDDTLNDWFFRMLPKYGTKIWLAYAESDHWVHWTSRDYVLNRYPDARVSLKEGETDFVHGFCVSQSVEASLLTSRILKESIPDINSY